MASDVELHLKPEIKAGDVLVLRIGHNPPAPFNDLAQQLFDALKQQGRECMVVVTPLGLDNMRPEDARQVLEALINAGS